MTTPRPDVFLSYSREDQATARRYAESLKQEGFSVWWDQTLSTGEAYDEVTEKALEGARAVVVLWSKTSVTSRWVRAEATTADRNRVLAPVMIEPCKRPVMFELTQSADHSHWKGDTNDPLWRVFVTDLHKFVQRGESSAAAAPESAPGAALPAASAARNRPARPDGGDRRCGRGADRGRRRSVRGTGSALPASSRRTTRLRRSQLSSMPVTIRRHSRAPQEVRRDHSR